MIKPQKEFKEGTAKEFIEDRIVGHDVAPKDLKKQKKKYSYPESQRKYYKKNLEKERARSGKNYYKNKDRINKKIDDKRKVRGSRARHNYLIRMQTNEIPKKKICDICGSTEKITHHHFTEPYKKFYFIDVCKECHSIVDRYEKRITKIKKEIGK